MPYQPKMAKRSPKKLSVFHTGKLQRFESQIVQCFLFQFTETVTRGPYNFLKIDVWGIGATVWELLEGTPPFLESVLADRWPPLKQKEHYSHSLHQFLDLCSRPAHSRPEASGLLKASNFVSLAD